MSRDVKPDGYSADTGRGMPSHFWSKRSSAWVQVPAEAFMRPEGWPSHVLVRGTWTESPDIETIEEWHEEGGCESVDGDWVEPDHPRSWMRFLRLI